MGINFEITSTLQYQIKYLRHELDLFRSGEKYIKMQQELRSSASSFNREIASLKREVAQAHAETVNVRNSWLQVVDDMEAEQTKERELLIKRIVELENALHCALIENSNKTRDFRALKQENYEALIELDKERETNKKLTSLLKLNHENSSIPSSQDRIRKPIKNNRVKSDKKVGGQPGHKGHVRKQQKPTTIVEISPPEEYLDNLTYEKTDIVKSRQVIGVQLLLKVVEYRTALYKHKATGKLVHADFPIGVDNEVNYDSSVKAFAFLLNNHCNVSIGKVQQFMSDLTGGALNLSTGMINGLSQEFADKSADDQLKIFTALVDAPVLNIDFTSAKVNGNNVHVFICGTPELAGYYAKEHKGHEGIKGTPAELNQNTHVHDHDLTFFNYGRLHQECLIHILRYLLACIEYETQLTWHKAMRSLIQEMIHTRKKLKPDEDMDEKVVKGFEVRFDEILDIAKKEYEYEPPTKQYRDGFNLSKRMREYKDACLLFLHDKNVPADNNLAERLGRVFKRKMRQVMTFRSFDSVVSLCQNLTVMATLRNQSDNFFQAIAAIFA